MKRLIAWLSSLLGGIIIAVALPLVAHADSTWSLQVYAPQSPSNTATINIEYKVLSINAHDFAVSLYVDSSVVASATNHTEVAGDPNTAYGNSGYFSVTLPNGSHSFQVTAVNQDNTSDTETSVKNIDVDTTPPPAPVYKGKTQSGNNYAVNFAAPNSADVTKIEIFASTSKTYTAGPSTMVGQETSVSPNQNFSFSYVAPDSTPRYFSVQSFDAAGNGSTLVGDPGTVVNPVVYTNQGGQGGAVATAQEAAATTPAGQVQGVSTGSPSNASGGQINAPGQSSTGKNSGQNNGKVLGTATVKHSSAMWWYIGGGILAALILAYWLISRRSKPEE